MEEEGTLRIFDEKREGVMCYLMNADKKEDENVSANTNGQVATTVCSKIFI